MVLPTLTMDDAIQCLGEITAAFRDKTAEQHVLDIARATGFVALYVLQEVSEFMPADDKRVFGQAGDGNVLSQQFANACEDCCCAMDAEYTIPMAAAGPIRKLMIESLLKMLAAWLADQNLDIGQLIQIVLDLLTKKTA